MARRKGIGTPYIAIGLLALLFIYVALSGNLFPGNITGQPVSFNYTASQISYSYNYFSRTLSDPGISGTTPILPIPCQGQSITVCASYAAKTPIVSSGNSITAPIGLADTEFNIAWQQGGIGQNYVTPIIVKMPANLPDQGCTSLAPVYSTPPYCPPNAAYGATISYGSPTILSSSTPQWTNDKCTADPCVQKLTQTITSGNQTSTRILYITRFYTTLFLSVTPSIAVSCASPSGSPSSYFGQVDSSYQFNCPTSSGVSQTCIPIFGCAGGGLDGAVQAGMGNILGKINSVSLAQNWVIGLYLSATWPTAITSNVDWYGIYQVNIGSGENSVCGSAGSSICTSGLQSHANLYTAPGFSPGYTELNGYTLSQLQSVTQNNIGSTVTVKVPVKSFGLQYSISLTGCGITTLNACFASTGSNTLSIPIIFDVIGSKSLAGQIVNPPPPPVLAGGIVNGKVLDGNGLLCGTGICGPLAGATITDGPICNAPGCSQVSATTANDGTYTMTLVQGSHTLWFYAPNYMQASQTISVAQGSSTSAPTITLLPLQPVGQTCLIQPLPNPIPGQPGIGGFCPPIWLVVLGIVVVAAIVIIIPVAIFGPGISVRRVVRR